MLWPALLRPLSIKPFELVSGRKELSRSRRKGTEETVESLEGIPKKDRSCSTMNSYVRMTHQEVAEQLIQDIQYDNG